MALAGKRSKPIQGVVVGHDGGAPHDIIMPCMMACCAAGKVM
jgi:hypothetical protein